MDSLTGAAIAAVFLPVPDAWFRRLRWVGAASIALVGLTLIGMPLPSALPAVVLGVGGVVALAWPTRQGAPPGQRERDAAT